MFQGGRGVFKNPPPLCIAALLKKAPGGQIVGTIPIEVSRKGQIVARTQARVILSFWAVTWNVFFGTKIGVLEPILNRLMEKGVSLYIMQEAAGKDIDRMLGRFGLVTKVFDEYRVAWDPNVWEYKKHRSRVTSKVPMFRTGSKKPVYKYILIVWLTHKLTGRTVKVVCYHTPSHVQRPEWNRAVPNRWKILQDTMYLFKLMAANSVARHLIFAGDDNSDETKASGGSLKRWDFALNTGLKQIQAPRPTHDVRKIDDFRIKGLEQLDEGFTGDGGGDHKFFACHFGFLTGRMKRRRN